MEALRMVRPQTRALTLALALTILGAPRATQARPPAAPRPSSPAQVIAPTASASSATTGKTVEQWLQQLKAPDAALRRQAAVSLCSYGPHLSGVAIGMVGEGLHDAEPSVRHATALSLGNFGPAARAALPAIRGALRDSSPLV